MTEIGGDVICKELYEEVCKKMSEEKKKKVKKRIVRYSGNTIVKCSQCGCLLYRSNAPKPEGQFDLINAVFCPQCGREFR